MKPIAVRPNDFDIAVANAIAAHTNRGTSKVARVVTWGADEHVLSALAVGWWLYWHVKKEHRAESNHVLVVTLVSSALPHLLKRLFNQTRPDRRTVRAHWRGIDFSGKRLDAFPSGHAVHIGALASAAADLPAAQRNVAWTIGGILVATRVLVLAHWVTDVVAGLAVGVAVDRLLRRATGQLEVRMNERPSSDSVERI